VVQEPAVEAASAQESSLALASVAVQEVVAAAVEDDDNNSPPLFPALSLEQLDSVERFIYSSGAETDIVARFGTNSVQRSSAHRLQPGELLNDEVIHFYLSFLSSRDEHLCHVDPHRKRSHFFKSFFMTSLLEGRYNYDNVRNWHRQVPGGDIFALDKIFFPINTDGGTHWVCAVVDMRRKRIQMYDSMGDHGKYFLECIFRYLQDEHVAVKGCSLPDKESWRLVGTTPDTPCQLNGVDCGVFTCMFADFLSVGRPLLFTQRDILRCRYQIALAMIESQREGEANNEALEWYGSLNNNDRRIVEDEIVGIFQRASSRLLDRIPQLPVQN